MNNTPLEFQCDIHKDCAPCPAYNPYGKCGSIGTGIHEMIDMHLMRAHGYSKDKMDGLRIASRVAGMQDIEIMVLAHQAILLFEPRTHASPDA